jgi:hypothetical protein
MFLVDPAHHGGSSNKITDVMSEVLVVAGEDTRGNEAGLDVSKETSSNIVNGGSNLILLLQS